MHFSRKIVIIQTSGTGCAGNQTDTKELSGEGRTGNFMRIYFLDTENIGAAWIDAVLRDEDVGEVVVFYTKNSQPVPLTALPRLGGIWPKLTFIECCVGQNALDFQLATELGFRVAGAPGDEYLILTRDAGYDAIVKYWQQKGISVVRITPDDAMKPAAAAMTPGTAAVAVTPAPAPVKAPAEKRRRTRAAKPKAAPPAEPGIAKRLADAELADAAEKVAAILERERGAGDDKRLTRIYRSLIQAFGQTQGLAIYNAVKPGIRAYYAKTAAPETPAVPAASEAQG